MSDSAQKGRNVLTDLPNLMARTPDIQHQIFFFRRCKDSVVEELWNHYQSCHSVDMEVFKNSTVNSELTRLETTVDGNHIGSCTTFIPQQTQPFLGARYGYKCNFSQFAFLGK